MIIISVKIVTSRVLNNLDVHFISEDYKQVSTSKNRFTGGLVIQRKYHRK